MSSKQPPKRAIQPVSIKVKKQETERKQAPKRAIKPVSIKVKPEKDQRNTYDETTIKAIEKMQKLEKPVNNDVFMSQVIDKSKKIVYGAKPLGKDERRATMQEAINKGQVRYWGLQPITIAQFKVAARKKILTQPLKYSKYARDKLDQAINDLEGTISIMEEIIKFSHSEQDKMNYTGVLKETKTLLKQFYKRKREQDKLWEEAGKPDKMKKSVKKV